MLLQLNQRSLARIDREFLRALFPGRLFARCGWFGTGEPQRVEYVETAAGCHPEDATGDFVRRVALYFAAALDAVRGATAGEEQPEVVVNFRGSGDGRARIARRVFLANGDCGRDAGDLVNIGLLHAFEKLAGIGGQGLDIAPLPFSVNSVKGQRGFAGTADAGDDGERIVRDFDGDVFEIVYTGAADKQNLLLRRGGSDDFVGGQG